ncbi:MAG: DNA-processing protein DprA [Pseudomonadota bacterium]
MTDKDATPSSTHPPLPPTQEDERFAQLRLLRSRRVGISTYKRLLAEHGTAQNALAALPEVARAAGVAEYRVCPAGVVAAELKAAQRLGAKLLSIDAAEYPETLAALSDAPPFLWTFGDATMLQRPMISIVGARNASSLGTRMAKNMARDLGDAGFVVVSGLARGVDAAAHLASLATGTIAVQAGGVDIIYPAENTELSLNIAKAGLRVSEQPIGLQPMARHFPSRNRLIAGLSQATIVIEAAAKSGSLITARDAADQGRDVLAVPGHPMDARAAGCNMLIRDGAILVRSAKDVIELLGDPVAARMSPMLFEDQTSQGNDNLTIDTVSLRQKILACLGPSPIAEDQLIRDLRASAAKVAPTLIDLELEGQIARRPGGLLTKAVGG